MELFLPLFTATYLISQIFSQVTLNNQIVTEEAGLNYEKEHGFLILMLGFSHAMNISKQA